MKTNNLSDDVRNRINEFIYISHLTKRSFAKHIEMEQVTINRQMNGENVVSLDTAISFLNHYPEISAEWLLRGEGSMNRRESASGGIATASGANSVAAINSEIHSGAEYRALQDKIQMLQQLLDEKERTIKILMNR